MLELFLQYHKESSKPVVTSYIYLSADSRMYARRLSPRDDIRGDGIEKDREANYLVSVHREQLIARPSVARGAASLSSFRSCQVFSHWQRSNREVRAVLQLQSKAAGTFHNISSTRVSRQTFYSVPDRCQYTCTLMGDGLLAF